MDDQKILYKIENKLEAINYKLNAIDVTLAKQSVILEEHTRRSAANERAVEILSDELKPVLSHVEKVKLLGKLLFGVISSSSILGIVRWLLVK